MSDRDRPDVIAHRGFAAEYPENTLAAVRAASRVADAIEVDVRRCGTGELVVFHDETLDRLTPMEGRVADTPCETLLELDIGGSGETIPTLEAVLEAIPADRRLVLELKEPGLAGDVLALLDGSHELMISSFETRCLAEAHEVDSTVSTAYLVTDSRRNRTLRPMIPGLPRWVYFHEDVRGMIETATDLRCDAIHPRYELCLQTNLVTQAHAAGLRVDAWTIRSPREYRALVDAGVYGVISDVFRGIVDDAE